MNTRSVPLQTTPELPHALHEIGGVRILRVHTHRLNWLHVPALSELLQEFGAGPLVVDVSEVEFMDTGALALILRAARKAGSRPGVAIAGPGEGLLPLFDSMGVSSHMIVAASAERAAGLLAGRRSA